MKELLKSLNYEIDALTKEFDILFDHPLISDEHYYNLQFISGVLSAATNLLYHQNDLITEENEKILEYKRLFNKFLKNPSTKTQCEFQLKCPELLHLSELNNYLTILEKHRNKWEDKEEYLKCATILALEIFLKSKITTTTNDKRRV